MGSCAQLWSLEPVSFERYLHAPPPPAPEAADRAVWQAVVDRSVFRDRSWAKEPERRKVIQCLFAKVQEASEEIRFEEAQLSTWRDDADNQLSRATMGDGFCDRLPVETAAEIFSRPDLIQSHPGAQLMFWEAAPAETAAAFRRIGLVLGLSESADRALEMASRLPWWVAARWNPDGYSVGLLTPPEVDSMVTHLKQTQSLSHAQAWDKALSGGCGFWAKALAGLETFLLQAAAAGAFILGEEGKS